MSDHDDGHSCNPGEAQYPSCARAYVDAVASAMVPVLTAPMGEHGRVDFWCPGCDMPHAAHTRGEGAWGYNGDSAAPTLTPSLLTRHGNGVVCHLFMRDGMLEFLSDSTHALAGQTVAMLPLAGTLLDPEGEHDE